MSSNSDDGIPRLDGRTVLVTGATSGVGLEAAKILASKQARVLVLLREQDDPDSTLEDIRQFCIEAGHLHPDIHFVECDLGNLEAVKRVGDELCDQENRLDILICDAGAGLQRFSATEDGIDRHFAISHLGHFLLINRLLPLLRRTANLSSPLPPRSETVIPLHMPRIVCVTSALHAAAPASVNFISFAELTAESGSASSPLSLYARAKLSTILFVKSFAALLTAHPQPASSCPRPGSPSADVRHPRGILALAADTGLVRPGQSAQLTEAYGLLLGGAAKLITAPLERTPGEAARSTLWAATATVVETEWERWQGAYVAAPGQEGGESVMACDAELGARLWAMSVELVKQRLGGDALGPWV
ncbi:NAD-P-binding protein [Trametes meyenii]|nr:NAD-P-binding protein [Trametes meyenii]